jgi:hypothetical protein
MRAVASNLVRIAADGPLRSVAQCALAEANAHCGRVEEATSVIDSLDVPATLVRAKLALLRGAAEEAGELALEAASASDGRDRTAAMLLAARAGYARAALALQSARPLSQSWSCLSRAVERAWDALESQRGGYARPIAATAFESAERAGFLGVAARAAAVLQAEASARGDGACARRWCALAIARLVRSGDALTAAGLFHRRVEIDASDDPSLAVLYEWICTIVPQMLGDSPSQRASVCELFGAVLQRLHRVPGQKRLEAAIAAVVRSDSAFAHYAAPCFPQIHEALSLIAAGTRRLSWSAAEHCARIALGGVARVRVPHPRAIPIVLAQGSQSQTPSLAHLMVDDGARRGEEPKPELAGLRVRIVSLRPGAGGALSRRRDDPAARSAFTASDLTHPR